MAQPAFNVYITACYVDIAYDSDPLYSPQIYLQGLKESFL